MPGAGSSRPSWPGVAVWVIVLWGAAWLLSFWGLGRAPFYSKGEPREALVVWEAVHAGNWALPRRNGTELPSKPPLFHWAAGVTALIAGTVDEGTARLPSALAATATMGLVCWYGARQWGLLSGACAALILATSFEWLRAARVARVDMVLAACLTVAFLAFGRAVASAVPSGRALACFYCSIALAVLAKGPVGLILPCLVGLAYLTLTSRLHQLAALHPVRGVAAALALPLAWYATAALQGGSAFIEKQLVGENLLRFLGARPGGGHTHPFYYYAPALLLGMLPWSPLFVPLGASLVARRRQLRADSSLYLLTCIAVVLAFYSLSSGKRAAYILPLYPAVALLLGRWWQQVIDGEVTPLRATEWLLRVYGVTAALAAAVVAALAAGEWIGAAPLTWIEPLLHPRDRVNLVSVGDAVRTQAPILIAGAMAVMTIGARLAWSARERRWHSCFLGLITATAAGALLVQQIVYPELAARRTLRPFFAEVRARVDPSEAVVFFDTFDYGAVFYAQRHIHVWRPATSPPDLDTAPAPYLLLRQRAWDQWPAATRVRLELVAESSGTGSSRTDRLVLVRIKPAG